MAEAVVGGAFLSAFLQVLFDRMASRDVIEFFTQTKLTNESLRKLKTTLLLINEKEYKEYFEMITPLWS